MSLTWLELPFDGGGGRGEGEGMAGFPHLPSLTRSVQIFLNNYPQRRKKRKSVEQILYFCLLWGCRPWSLLIQPSLPSILRLGRSVVMSQ